MIFSYVPKHEGIGLCIQLNVCDEIGGVPNAGIYGLCCMPVSWIAEVKQLIKLCE